jgi:two-component system LytT family response regulator
MKPVEEDKLAATLDVARQRLAEKRAGEEAARLKEVLAEVAPEAAAEMSENDEAPSANRFEKMINIKDRGQIFRVDVDTIERIDAAGDYMCIYTGDNTLILRETMKDLEKRLDPRRFQRVHRSTIVNLDQVKEVKPHTNGECFLVLGSGAQVTVSRSYRDVVARFVHSTCLRHSCFRSNDELEGRPAPVIPSHIAAGRSWGRSRPRPACLFPDR